MISHYVENVQFRKSTSLNGSGLLDVAQEENNNVDDEDEDVLTSADVLGDLLEKVQALHMRTAGCTISWRNAPRSQCTCYKHHRKREESGGMQATFIA